MWFSKDLEKDKVFRTNRDTRCLNVLLNRDWVAGFTTFFSYSKGGAYSAELPHMLPKSQCMRSRIGDLTGGKDSHNLSAADSSRAPM
jgi:hypothetical protein